MESLGVFTDILATASIIAAHVVGYAGIFVMIYGALKSAWIFATHLTKESRSVVQMRIEFGTHLALGLEFLVAKDIIETLVEQTWDDLMNLAVIVLLRTLLTLVLGWEIKEARKELSHPLPVA